jgi:hypothetical protein
VCVRARARACITQEKEEALREEREAILREKVLKPTPDPTPYTLHPNPGTLARALTPKP